MITKFFSFLFLIVLFFNSFAQIKSKDLKNFQLSKEEYQKLKSYLQSKNLTVKDTLFIKYDFNKENCWDMLDKDADEQINIIKKGFQDNISKFNKTFKDAVAYNFRESGERINKLKLWDTTIIIDDQNILKNLIFKKKTQCGSSAVILSDGSYLIYKGDPHFELLNLHHNYKGNRF